MRISMWDSKEPHKYNILPNFFFNKAHGVVFMFSYVGKRKTFIINIDPSSFYKVQKWVEKLLEDPRGKHNNILYNNHCFKNL